MFTVTLHHLSPDAKRAGSTFADTELADVTEKKLRALIRALAGCAIEKSGAATPELRVAAPHGQFVVQASGGRLRINSWTMRVGGADLSPDQIFTLICGSAAVADATADVAAAAGKRSRRGLLVACAVLILASNSLTAWLLMRQPETPFLPAFTRLDAEPAQRFLSSVAGEYQSGTAEGARALRLTPDGPARWRTFGPNGTVVEESDLAVHPVQSRGRPALLADDRALIEFPDPVSLVFYNETYRRKAP
jgi:hypothetical protein